MTERILKLIKQKNKLLKANNLDEWRTKEGVIWTPSNIEEYLK